MFFSLSRFKVSIDYMLSGPADAEVFFSLSRVRALVTTIVAYCPLTPKCFSA